MRQQVILNIKGYPVKVEITYSTRNVKSYRICFGCINAKIRKDYPLKKLEADLNRVFSENVVKKFNKEPFIDTTYAYIFGVIERIYPKIEDPKSLDDIKVLYNGKKITPQKLLLEYLTVKVKQYEQMMGLKNHIIKVKHLTAALGNNHYTTGVLTFNEMLVHFDPYLIDQVILHELCHDFHHNHSDKFYKTLSYYCKDHKERKEKLIYGIRR